MDDHLLNWIDAFPKTRLLAGEMIFEQGARSRFLVFLIEGCVEVVKDGRIVDRQSLPGSIYGELSVLLNDPHMSGLRAATDCILVKIENPRQFFLDHPALMLHLCQTMAERLTAATRYLVDVRRQFSKDSGHLAIMDKILTTLIHRNPKSGTTERVSIRPDH